MKLTNLYIAIQDANLSIGYESFCPNDFLESFEGWELKEGAGI